MFFCKTLLVGQWEDFKEGVGNEMGSDYEEGPSHPRSTNQDETCYIVIGMGDCNAIKGSNLLDSVIIIFIIVIIIAHQN